MALPGWELALLREPDASSLALAEIASAEPGLNRTGYSTVSYTIAARRVRTGHLLPRNSTAAISSTGAGQCQGTRRRTLGSQPRGRLARLTSNLSASISMTKARSSAAGANQAVRSNAGLLLHRSRPSRDNRIRQANRDAARGNLVQIKRSQASNSRKPSSHLSQGLRFGICQGLL
jgi:hypothetical protein